MTVKTCRLGNSIVVTIPASFNIGENGEYQPIIDENGVISLLPVKHHIFRVDAGLMLATIYVRQCWEKILATMIFQLDVRTPGMNSDNQIPYQ